MKSILPAPRLLELRQGGGAYVIASTKKIYHDEASCKAALLLRDHLSSLMINVDMALLPDNRTGIRGEIKGAVIFGTVEGEKPHYDLKADSRSVEIFSTGEEAALLACSTLIQIIDNCSSKGAIPSLFIHDYPHYARRGLMIDVARNFFDVQVLKRLIDEMFILKLNILHIHLTDNEGWRFEVPGFPKLTQGIDFYTDEEISDLARYAGERGIDIVPEIDLPGHSFWAARAYPEYFDGKKNWNPDIRHSRKMLERIYAATSRLFPGKYVHIGCDEVSDTNWHLIDSLYDEPGKIPTDKIKLERHFYSKFVSENIAMLKQHGKSAICWDDVMDGNFDQDAVIQWWRIRRPDALLRALSQNHKVILSPASHVYFDYQQGNGEPGAQWEGLDNGIPTLEKLLNWEIIPDYIAEEYRKNIIGIEGCIWTEYIKSERYMQFMIFPRLAALSQLAWRDEARVKDFRMSLEYFYKRWENLGYKYRKSELDANEFRTH